MSKEQVEQVSAALEEGLRSEEARERLLAQPEWDDREARVFFAECRVWKCLALLWLRREFAS